MILFFDTETNGLPINYNGKVTDVENWPRIIQLGYIVTDLEGNIVKEYKELIKPEGWVIPKTDFWINNGYSTEQSNEKGIDIKEALNSFIKDIENSILLCAHNLKFDHNVVGAEMIRLKLSAERKPKFCTMENTVDILQLPGKFEGKFKWPKLEELHHYLFNEGFEGAHDAMMDVKATAKCFFELNKRNLLPTEIQSLIF
jgi:DNA polymerase III epsilon subunit-like protein